MLNLLKWRVNSCSINPPDTYTVIIIAVGYVLLIVVGWHNYFVWSNIQSLAGLMLLGYIIFTTNYTTQKSSRYFWPAILLALISWLVPVRTFLYFSICCSILFFIESYWSKCGVLPLVVMIIISPLFQYFFTVFTFPLKLQLTGWAVQLLSVLNDNVTALGNIIVIKGGHFRVDDECMGISMTGIGMLTGVTLLVYYKKITGRGLSWLVIAIALLFLFILLVVANLIRIVLLAQFQLPPQTVMHEVTGLICFIVYFLLPALAITRLWIKKVKKQEAHVNKTSIPAIAKNNGGEVLYKKVSKKFYWLLHTLLLVVTACSVINLAQYNTGKKNTEQATPAVAGFTATAVNSDILKLQNRNALVYIKRIENFYTIEHSPMICWQGSGYRFENITHETINGVTAYFGMLQQGKTTLYTAWWFDNGSYKTTAQLAWRWKMLKENKNFAIVNVTAANRNELLAVLKDIYINNRLKKAIEAD